MHILLRVLAGIAGALLLYVAFFLYEDEEARIQNRLEQIWKRINALQSSAMSKEVAFLQGVTRTTSGILDRFLGQKFLSAQSITVSLAFSAGSTLSFLKTPAFLIAVPFFIYGSLPALSTVESPILRVLRPFTNGRLYLGLIILLLGAVTFLFHSVSALLVVLAIFGGGLVTDVLFIILFRWVLAKIAGLRSFWTITVCFIAVTATVILMMAPLLALLAFRPGTFEELMQWLAQYCRRHLFYYHYLVLPTLRAAQAWFLISMSNLVDALCLVLLIVIMLLLLAHRLIWPLIKRSIYAANRKQLIENTKLLGALGVALLIFAFPHNRYVQWITRYVPFLRS
jgi:hypothetical protein